MQNLNLVWFILKEMGIQTPSLARVKSFKLPHIQPPIQVVISNEIYIIPLFVLGIFFQHLSCKGIPFYSTPLSAVLRLCLGPCDLATAVARYPMHVEGRFM